MQDDEKITSVYLEEKWFTVELRFDKDKCKFRMLDENGREILTTKTKLSQNLHCLKSLSFSSLSKEAFYIDNLDIE